MKNLLLSTSLCILGIALLAQEPTTEIKNFKKYYYQYKVDGSFILYDQTKNKYIIYNQDQVNEPFIPASTFKICNSLIGLETGVIADENFIISWDSVVRRIPAWNQTQDLKTAFKNSTVWYYQELARRIGGKQMKYWLDKSNYGNADTTGGIDSFWLDGGIRITPEQQIDFLRRLQGNSLPFSQRSMDIVKDIMIAKDTLGYVLRAKTGWADNAKVYIGWYVGYFEIKSNVYYFANCIQTGNFDHKDFGKARINIVYQIFEDLKIIKK